MIRPWLRSDLQWSRRTRKQRTRWMARDPITLKFFWFGDREYRLLSLFKGQKTLPEIQAVWRERNALDPLDERELAQFVRRLESQGIVQIPGVVSAQRTEDQLRRKHRSRWLSLVGSPLAMRLPLLDPTPLLDRFDGLRRILFRPALLIVSLVLVALVGAFTTAVMSTQWFDRRLLEQLLAGEGVFYFAMAFVLLKSLHELGHALACRHFGGECHEVGVMLLVLVPCLYCDVSDAWKLESRFARIMISSAGMIVELICAALAAIVWMITEPSPIQSVAFSIMLVGSLGTVLINGNPLLRYDGYYILSDWVGIPNLAQQSQEAVHSLVRRVFFRYQTETTHWDADARWLRIYGVAAWAYRLLLLGLIFVGLYQWLNPLGLQWVLLPLSFGVLLAAYGRVHQIIRFIRRERSELRPWMTLTGLVGLGLVIYFFFFVPLPSRVVCRGLVQRSPRESVYAPADAALLKPLDATAATGTVSAGAFLVQLESIELRLQQIQLSGEVAALRQRIEDLAARQVDDLEAASQLATARQSLKKTLPQLEQVNERVDELSVHAPLSGIVMTGARERMTPLSARPDATPISRRAIQRSLDLHNRGAVFPRGTQLAVVASDTTWNAAILVSEAELPWVRVGATTRLRLDRDLNSIFTGRVEAISARPLEQTPEPLQSDTVLRSLIDPRGRIRPATPHYSVNVVVEPTAVCPSHNAIVSASIDSPPRILAQRVRDFMLRLLHGD
ncbi:site-2 protease family protein [Neorhodopirellula pilleata]|uniref:Peptidase family M50 n=1 Tax=Neorhodopirellula pilleata TaxID=2714738 RepID=A0A5C6AUD6_9BACT|nr:site-2 protease family protein [Neorhodopirellula pilleata]TWU03605.1 Peptidase family M50 [Neorhodopirellula pilleata]